MDLSIYNTFHDIVQRQHSLQDQKRKLNRLFQVILDEALQDEIIHFTSLFSKIAYLASRYEIAGTFLYELHYLRKRIENPDQTTLEEDVHLLTYIVPHLFEKTTSKPIPDVVRSYIPETSGIKYKEEKIHAFLPFTKFLCTRINRSNKHLIGFLKDFPNTEKQVEYHITERNERFSRVLEELDDTRLPVLIELIEVEFTQSGILRPKAFVLEPDFLVDVTSIASCFDHHKSSTTGYIYKKFLPISWSKHLLLGNIANYFLDRLVGNPDLQFEELLKDIFKIAPLSFARIADHEMAELLSSMKKHFFNIKQSIQLEFKKERIELKHSYLEPSFMSNKYGIQGRLDLLHLHGEATSIVELKSGSIYMPNAYGLKNDHYIQTLLYDLLIRSTYEHKNPRNFILYSKESQRTLRIAPRITAQQKEALKVRNELLDIELKLASLDTVSSVLHQVNQQLHPMSKGFEARNIQQFEQRYDALTSLEKDYFQHFVSFIALEHRLAKIGEYGQDKSNGLAGLWLDSPEEKCEQFNIITQLEILENRSSESVPTIQFQYSADSNKLSNFRPGDIIILYPVVHHHLSSLKNQIFKCTIIEFQDHQITVKLRSQQKNQDIFKQHKRWAIEHDMMDSSFLAMYRQLYEWAGAPKTKRDALLSKTGPKKSVMPSVPVHVLDHPDYKLLTGQQRDILAQMIHQEDYYLVWGPPGTGKTSVMIKYYIKYILDHTDENLYVIAYTNRAVDELCAAIHALGSSYADQYIRIGSSYNTDPVFKHKLLQSKIESIDRRKILRNTIKKHRIVVATLASIISKEIIFELIPTSRIIVDEASQILECNIIGLLTRFKQFILVGDHRQLPAVVIQKQEESAVQNEGLQQIGLLNRRDSLFERLYKQCLQRGWKHAIGQLQYQGRMHEVIMKFPNQHFYNNSLNTLQGMTRLNRPLPKTEQTDVFQAERMIFQHIEVPIDEKFSKTNASEALCVLETVEKYTSLSFPLEEIGVITPFRAQIAAIKDLLLQRDKSYEAITVDTVERFQGAAKQVIIISFCCNSTIQFKTLVSVSEEGIDRKLNVALTRAKEHVVLIGDESILSNNPLYKSLIDYCVRLTD